MLTTMTVSNDCGVADDNDDVANDYVTQQKV